MLRTKTEQPAIVLMRGTSGVKQIDNANEQQDNGDMKTIAIFLIIAVALLVKEYLSYKQANLASSREVMLSAQETARMKIIVDHFKR